MKTDRELLELAANAAGMPAPDSIHPTSGFVWIKARDGVTRETRWNPLTDDGDALRLAVKLNIGVMSAMYTGRTCAWRYCKGRDGEVVEEHGNDINQATRRAIVRAAAKIVEAP